MLAEQVLLYFCGARAVVIREVVVMFACPLPLLVARLRLVDAATLQCNIAVLSATSLQGFILHATVTMRLKT